MSIRRAMSFVVFVVLFGWAAAFAAGGSSSNITPDAALQRLKEGNKRFVKSHLTHHALTIKETREESAGGQKPYAVVLSCSDSRVPPEIVFDETLGRFFVVRVAGNTLDPLVLGSIEYAVEHLGSSLIMVLGHERCGAVSAAFDASGKVAGNVGAVVEPILPAVQKAKEEARDKGRGEQLETAIDINVALVAQGLTAQSSLIRDYVDRGALKIVRGKYHFHSGEVIFLDSVVSTVP